MTKNEEQVKEFKDLHNAFMKLVNQVPTEQRETVLFDQWSLKDILAHIGAWNLWSVQHVGHVIKKENVYWEGVEEFNQRVVAESKDWKFEEVIKDLNSSVTKLVDTYKRLPEKIWDTSITFTNVSTEENKNYTPRYFLVEDIGHYKDEHIPQLQESLKNSKS